MVTYLSLLSLKAASNNVLGQAGTVEAGRRSRGSGSAGHGHGGLCSSTVVVGRRPGSTSSLGRDAGSSDENGSEELHFGGLVVSGKLTIWVVLKERMRRFEIIDP